MPFVQVPCFIYTSTLLLSPSTVCFERSILRTSVSWIGAVKSRLLYCAPVSTIAAQLKYHRIMAGGCGHKSGQKDLYAILLALCVWPVLPRSWCSASFAPLALMYALVLHWVAHWFHWILYLSSLGRTRERPKGTKDEVKRPKGPPARSRSSRAIRLLLHMTPAFFHTN